MNHQITEAEIQAFLKRKEYARRYAREYRQTHKGYHAQKQREYRARLAARKRAELPDTSAETRPKTCPDE